MCSKYLPLVYVCRNKIGLYLCTATYNNKNVNLLCILCFTNSYESLIYIQQKLFTATYYCFIGGYTMMYNYNNETIASTYIRAQLYLETFVYNFRPREECLIRV